MTRWPLTLRSATARELDVIIGLIEDAASWLRTKNTDQWTRPWPDREGRDERVLADLDRGRTWIVWDGTTAAATITADPDEDPRWPERWRNHPAIYVQRQVVSRPYAGVSLGAELLDWAGRKGRSDHGAAWIRVSAWKTNKRLHAYYQSQGFVPCGLCDDRDGYPAGARFQKPTSEIKPTGRGLSLEAPPTG